MSAYQEFLAAEAAIAASAGFDIDPAAIHPALLPHQRDIVRWALAGGGGAASIPTLFDMIELEAS